MTQRAKNPDLVPSLDDILRRKGRNSNKLIFPDATVLDLRLKIDPVLTNEIQLAIDEKDRDSLQEHIQVDDALVRTGVFYKLSRRSQAAPTNIYVMMQMLLGGCPRRYINAVTQSSSQYVQNAINKLNMKMEIRYRNSLYPSKVGDLQDRFGHPIELVFQDDESSNPTGYDSDPYRLAFGQAEIKTNADDELVGRISKALNERSSDLENLREEHGALVSTIKVHVPAARSKYSFDETYVVMQLLHSGLPRSTIADITGMDNRVIQNFLVAAGITESYKKWEKEYKRHRSDRIKSMIV